DGLDRLGIELGDAEEVGELRLEGGAKGLEVVFGDGFADGSESDLAVDEGLQLLEPAAVEDIERFSGRVAHGLGLRKIGEGAEDTAGRDELQPRAERGVREVGSPDDVGEDGLDGGFVA